MKTRGAGGTPDGVATPDQFRRAYPMADAVIAAKDRWDPNRIFRNLFEAWMRGE